MGERQWELVSLFKSGLTRRWEWLDNQPDLDPDHLVFIDET